MSNLQHFMDGFRNFQRQLYRDNERLAAKLVKGQSPKTLVISCSDSRVDPALLTVRCSVSLSGGGSISRRRLVSVP